MLCECQSIPFFIVKHCFRDVKGQSFKSIINYIEK